MIKVVIKVVTSWQVIAAATLFIVILVLLFSDRSKVNLFKSKKVTKEKRAFTRKKKDNNDKQTKNSTNRKEEPGKLYVPDSTYEILKKEGIMHNHDDN